MTGSVLRALRAPEVSLYEHVGERLESLLALFNIEDAGATIRHAYARLCRQSLDMPFGRRPIGASRLNADGIPFQFALALGAADPALQFLAEAAPPDAAGAERIAAARRCIRDLAGLIGAQAALSVVSPWLDALAPADDAELLSDEAGAIWVGAALGAGGSARLKVYANAKWGSANSRWARLDAYAARLGVATDWRGAHERLSGLQPLGASLVIGAGAAPAGRIYLSGYGKPWHEYEALGRHFGGPVFGFHLRQYGQTLLGDDCVYPTRSAVVSLGLQHGAIADVKVELCAHCAFDSDIQARSRCVQWLRQIGVDPALYLQMVDRMRAGPLCSTETRLHSYLGIGSGRGRPDSTFYFNPATARA